MTTKTFTQDQLEAIAAAERVVAVGTSVMRALESFAESGQREGVAVKAIEPTTKLRVVDALITGIHSPQESHYRLLGALLPPEKLAEAVTLAMAAGLEPHEFGDVAFIHKA